MFVRHPDPGTVKTRLAAALGPAAAAALYRGFIEDLCATLGGRRFRMVLACTPDRGGSYLARLAKRHALALVPQGDGDLGRRMERVAAGVLETARRVVLIGSDAPTLPPAFVERAFQELRRRPVVLGPSLDGGYYLVGVRAPIAPIFRRMRWSDESVLSRTVRRLDRADVPYELLPCWYDVDTVADLGLLARHVAVLETIGERPAPRTARVLRRIGHATLDRSRVGATSRLRRARAAADRAPAARARSGA